MKTKKIPMRSCVVTKEKYPKKELLRIVRTPEGKIIIDETGKNNGRGAHLKKDKEEQKIVDLCEKEHCHCEHGIVKSALTHTIHITIFILLITFLINMVIHFIGEDVIAGSLMNKPILGPMIAGLLGLIPNCASSVILTQMYLENVISVATMISGLLVSAGVGLAVLFKMNKGIKENLKIVVLLYSIGVISGIILELIGLNF